MFFSAKSMHEDGSYLIVPTHGHCRQHTASVIIKRRKSKILSRSVLGEFYSSIHINLSHCKCTVYLINVFVFTEYELQKLGFTSFRTEALLLNCCRHSRLRSAVDWLVHVADVQYFPRRCLARRLQCVTYH